MLLSEPDDFAGVLVDLDRSACLVVLKHRHLLVRREVDEHLDYLVAVLYCQIHAFRPCDLEDLVHKHPHQGPDLFDLSEESAFSLDFHGCLAGAGIEHPLAPFGPDHVVVDLNVDPELLEPFVCLHYFRCRIAVVGIADLHLTQSPEVYPAAHAVGVRSEDYTVERSVFRELRSEKGGRGDAVLYREQYRIRIYQRTDVFNDRIHAVRLCRKDEQVDVDVLRTV